MDEGFEPSEELILRRETFEPVVKLFQGQKMWFNENRIQFDGIVNVKTDSWGVTLTITSEHRDPLKVSGRWDILYVRKSRISAAYAGWMISRECYYPEIGISI